VVLDVIDLNETYSMLTATLGDRIAFLSTFLGVLFLQIDFAIYLGVGVSLVLYLREATRLDLREYVVDEDGNLKHITDPSERLDPDVAVIDVNGEAFFGSADQIQQRVRDLYEESDELQVIILRMKNAGNIDITGAAVLRQIALELEDNGMTLMLCGTTPRVREVLEEANVTEIIGEDKILVAQKNLLESTRAALERAQEHIDEVLEGELDREEEDPSLKHTMEDLDDGAEEGNQDPIETEKQTVDDHPEDSNG
jgi:SulP family sulfate permease